MNSSLEPPRTVVFALCGSFCTFETVLPQIIRLRACGWEVLPMLSYAASALDTRFGRAADCCDLMTMPCSSLKIGNCLFVE